MRLLRTDPRLKRAFGKNFNARHPVAYEGNRLGGDIIGGRRIKVVWSLQYLLVLLPAVSEEITGHTTKTDNVHMSA